MIPVLSPCTCTYRCGKWRGVGANSQVVDASRMRYPNFYTQAGMELFEAND